MPLPPTYPGVYVEEVPSGVRTIAGVATSIALFIGWAARGPTDRAVRLSSFADYESHYGGLDQRTLLGYAVRHFFDNGGADAYVIRICKLPGEAPADGDAIPASAVLGDLSVEAASPGEWANKYGVRLTQRASDPNDPEAEKRFDLEVLLDTDDDEDAADVEPVIEVYEDLSMSKSDPRFVETVVNERSLLIKVNAAETAATPAGIATEWLDGGKDGDVLAPNDSEFNEAVLVQFAEGKIADRLDLFNIVCVPGETEPSTIQELQTACGKKRAFLVVDCPESAQVDTVAAELLATIGPDARNSAFYFPWVRAPDPLMQGAVRPFPPCGFVAGIYARTDSTRGVWKAPAGREATLEGAAGLEVPMSEAENGRLNPRAVNCLRTLPVYGAVVWGSRTMVGADERGSEWKYVPVRRMSLFLEESIYRGTQWVVFEPNDEPLWSQIRLNVGAFMHNLFRQGVFQGRTASEAYFVKCDRDTTTQADIDLGVVNIVVGFAPIKPAEFVVLHIQQIAGAIPT